MLYEIKKRIFQNYKKKEIDKYLAELVRILDKKEKYRYHDRDDPDYYGIKDIKNLFGDVDDYYKPVLVESFLRMITNIMNVEEIQTKNCQ